MDARDSHRLLLDGATGTELDRRGVDTSLPLWSARAITDAPDVLSAIHRDYLLAGADIITANTFRTQERTLAQAGRPGQGRELTLRAVEIARRARDAINSDAQVAGSVAPMADCYEPDRSPPFEQCLEEHADHIDALIEGGADLLLIETMNTVHEARAAIEVARERLPGRWIASCCLRSDGPSGVLLSGEPVGALGPYLAGAFAVGVNCASAASLAAQIDHLRRLVEPGTRLIAYANIGRPDPVRGWVNTDAVNPARYAEHARTWLKAGASIIGGCCGTTPATIAALAALKV
ncbi:MAG: homocysteine S-methyltransferase family protein [Phycisphaerales bacterium]|nr:homocysteine S-methyltransferase family protein [Phycisphaerales bacterium]